MSKRQPVLFRLVDDETEEDFCDRFAEMMTRSDQDFMNEINRQNEQALQAQLDEHDRNISAFLERMRQDPSGTGLNAPPGTSERSPGRAGGMNHPSNCRRTKISK